MPIRKDPSHFIEPVIALAKDAGRRIMEIYQSEFKVGTKEDDSPLTAADLASHHCLVEGLEKLRPHYPVLSEESKSLPYAERSAWETYWLIDPLDGTKEFVKRNGEFTVNIALIHRQVPVLGVVYAPAKDLCYFASEGCGAFRQQGTAEPETIRAEPCAPARVRVVGSRSHGGAELETYLKQVGEHELVSIGSSLKLCLVAEGSADLYPRIGLTSEWDTAAAHCVVNEAGGAVTDLHGQPLLYNAKESLLNPYFLVYGDKSSRDWSGYAAEIATPAPPKAKQPPPLLPPVIALAKAAGTRIMDIYQSDFRVGHKEDQSPLTAADLASHHCLVEGLEKLYPQYPVLSEESKALPYAERSAWDTYWLIDPLDGTKEFVKRNGEFTVNVALIRGNVPVLGVVYAPAMGLCYYAAEGYGAFRQADGAEPEAIQVVEQAADPLRVVGSRSHGGAELETYLSRVGAHELVSIGSSLKLCLVAEGSADLYPRIGLTSEWDTAAAHAVVQAAGGEVIDLKGQPLRYNAKDSILNPYFIVYGDKSRDWAGYAAGIEG
jgi:3'(2'), 5'-bisphosphate nucleotidase